jgi:purine-binding chemotaxis protein CheW
MMDSNLTGNGNRQENQIEEHFNLQSVLWFTLGTEDYAIRVDHVQTVLDEMILTPVPNTPRFALGVINLRGLIIPVVDLKEMFQMPKGDIKDRMAIVVEVDNMRVGIAVDNVREVLDIDFSKLQPPPPSLSGLGSEYVVGMYRLAENILIVVDLVKVIHIAKEMISKYS